MQWINLPGLTPYEEAIEIMERRVGEVISGAAPETVYLLEHAEVYTAGTGASSRELLDPGLIPVVHTGRGGKFTYHGPGQKIIYPLINLAAPHRKTDIKAYVLNLENWIISTLGRLGVAAYVIPGKVGVWVSSSLGPAKIGAIGIRVRRWVTYHGIAVNINPDLKNYSGIIPCGITEFPVTSLEELSVKVAIEEFDLILKTEFAKIFDAKI